MIWLLLFIYQIKHFLCDYVFQTEWMLGKFKKYPDYILPLFAHSSTHGVATFLIALFFNPKIAFYVGALDLVVHFGVDRIKASPDMLGRFKALSGKEYVALTDMCPQALKPIGYSDSAGHGKETMALCGINETEKKAIFRANTFFWWSLGADQMVHHLTHYAIIWLLLH